MPFLDYKYTIHLNQKKARKVAVVFFVLIGGYILNYSIPAYRKAKESVNWSVVIGDVL